MEFESTGQVNAILENTEAFIAAAMYCLFSVSSAGTSVSFLLWKSGYKERLTKVAFYILLALQVVLLSLPIFNLMFIYLIPGILASLVYIGVFVGISRLLVRHARARKAATVALLAIPALSAMVSILIIVN